LEYGVVGESKSQQKLYPQLRCWLKFLWLRKFLLLQLLFLRRITI
jgi:hypothetical protein